MRHRGSATPRASVRRIITGRHLIILLCAGLLAVLASQVQPFSHPPSASAIQHIVIILKENRSFDYYFGRYPGADGATSGVLPSGQRIPLAVPSDTVAPDIWHGPTQSRQAIAGGRMNGFSISPGAVFDRQNHAYASMTQAQIPSYWAYAQHFVLADHFFSTISGPTFPNHLATVAGQSFGVDDNPQNISQQAWGCDSGPHAYVDTLTLSGQHVGVPPCFSMTTIADTLTKHGVNWRFYAPNLGEPGYIFSTFDAIKQIRETSQWAQHVVHWTTFEADARAGHLPPVSWVATNAANSDHPPASTCAAENSVVSQVNAIMSGPDWASTLIVVTWDDYGGFYDHVVPPTKNQLGWGIRVPALFISPYARAGSIDHTPMSFPSLLSTIEQVFHLPALGSADRSAPSFTAALDLRQHPLPRLLLPQLPCPNGSALVHAAYQYPLLLDDGGQNGQRRLLTDFPNGALHTLLLPAQARLETRGGALLSLGALQRGDRLLLQGGTTDAPLLVRDLSAP